MGYRINALRNGILAGHNATLGSNNLIVENIMMNDNRNDTKYQCVILLQDIIQRRSDRTFLYVTGKYHYRVRTLLYLHMYVVCTHVYSHML